MDFFFFLRGEEREKKEQPCPTLLFYYYFFLGGVGRYQSGAGEAIFAIINQEPKIDLYKSFSSLDLPESDKDSGARGLGVEFRNVKFSYPSAPERLVLNDISFTVEAGQVGGRGGKKASRIEWNRIVPLVIPIDNVINTATSPFPRRPLPLLA